MDSAILILTTLLSAAAATISGLVLWNLRSLSYRMDRIEDQWAKADARLQRVEQQRVICKDDFVSTGQWTREAGFTRRQLTTVVEQLNKVVGKMDSIDQMPQVAGQIASQVTRQILKREDNGRSDKN